ncbi:MAG: long-chain fatty acid--CoA ligase, partial [Magnetospirillum sp.]|nr:long-chain fatty acid--CoA ligase [Magnetospirillum sp.]
MREVITAIRATAAALPDRLAISETAGTLTYAELTSSIDRLAAALVNCPDIVGLLMPRGAAYVVADLALAALGRTIVPLPDFFSLEQWQHMVSDARMGAVLTTLEECGRLTGLAVPVLLAEPLAEAAPIQAAASRRIIYTSGTTGRPKGVVLDETAMTASLNGLAQAVGVRADDIHLSALPFSLLLEQLAGILLPLKSGARLHIAASPQQVPQEAERVGATTSVLVPDLLAGWVGGLRQSGRKAPSSLRFVAVGG